MNGINGSFVAEFFTNSPGQYVKLDATIAGLTGLADGDYDDVDEQAFYLRWRTNRSPAIDRSFWLPRAASISATVEFLCPTAWTAS